MLDLYSVRGFLSGARRRERRLEIAERERVNADAGAREEAVQRHRMQMQETAEATAQIRAREHEVIAAQLLAESSMEVQDQAGGTTN